MQGTAYLLLHTRQQQQWNRRGIMKDTNAHHNHASEQMDLS
jgi:hypothetical protein